MKILPHLSPLGSFTNFVDTFGPPTLPWWTVTLVKVDIFSAFFDQPTHCGCSHGLWITSWYWFAITVSFQIGTDESLSYRVWKMYLVKVKESRYSWIVNWETFWMFAKVRGQISKLLLFLKGSVHFFLSVFHLKCKENLGFYHRLPN